MAVFGTELPAKVPWRGGAAAGDGGDGGVVGVLTPGRVPPPVTQAAPVTCGATESVHWEVPLSTNPALAVAVTVNVPLAPAVYAGETEYITLAVSAGITSIPAVVHDGGVTLAAAAVTVVAQASPVSCGRTASVHWDVPLSVNPAFAVAVTVKVPVAPAV